MKNTRKERRHTIRGKQVPKVVGAKLRNANWLRHLGTKKTHRDGVENGDTIWRFVET